MQEHDMTDNRLISSPIHHFLLALIAGMVMSASSQAAEPFSFGVLNQQPAAETAALWNPILQHLQAKTGLSFKFKMGPTVQDTDAMTARGDFDFLYSNHNFEPDYSQANYQPIVQWGGKPLVGQIVVLADSPYKTLKDINGKTVAFPSKDAFIAYKVTRQALKKAGIEIKSEFGASQQGAAVQLQTGRAEAASLNKMFADKFQAEGKATFRVLYESDAWPNIPVSVHPRVSKEHVAAVKQALLDMSNDAEGQALLGRLKVPGFLPVADDAYSATKLLYQEKL
jgi:phosphonate transport system substrate-binding protein